ncbi:5'-methylthioadenosine/S-adenosylhomocysteine nucleosidase family protein [Atopobiaceae bacterium HCP3S3_A4]
MHTIALASPLPIETAVFFELPGAPAKERFCIPYVERSFAGVRLVAATSGMGMTNMAGCVQFLIDSFEPDALILSGIAGSLNPELGIGDIVLGETLSCLECSASVIAECAPYTESFHSDEALIGAAMKALRKRGFAVRPAVSAFAARSLEELPFGTDEKHGPRCCTGTILSSNLFTTAPDLLHEHRRTLLGDCEEMEGAAAAQLCARADIPFLAVRSISNVCGEAYSELNDAGARMDATARLAAKVVLDTIGIYASEGSFASSNPA